MVSLYEVTVMLSARTDGPSASVAVTHPSFGFLMRMYVTVPSEGVGEPGLFPEQMRQSFPPATVAKSAPAPACTALPTSMSLQ